MWNQSSGADESRKDVSISDRSRNPIDLGGNGDNKNRHIETVLNDKEEFLASSASGIDSGFLSGPQLSGLVDCDDYKIDNPKKKDNNSNIAPDPKKFTSTDSAYLDSGCIEEDIEEDEGIQSNSGQSTKDKTATTTSSKKQEDHMILDSGIDSGLSEWFCSLSLKTTDQPLNNLSTCQNSQKKSSTPTSSATSTPTSSNGKSQVNIGTTSGDSQAKKGQQQQQPWEIYYQQNDDGDTQLHIAIIIGYTEVVCALIRLAIHPCLLDIQNDNCQSALHLAVLTGQTEIIRRLLVAGAKATVRDRDGNTPLHLACTSGDLASVKALTIPITAAELQEFNNQRAHGDNKDNSKHYPSPAMLQQHRCTQLPPDLELRNYEGKRCIHLAADGTHLDVLRHLVWFGADLNAREGKSGQTPLHYAIETGNEVLTRFLLEECHQKLNIETTTYGGLTAYQIAAQCKNQQFLVVLENHGAEQLTPPSSDIESDIDSDFEDNQMYDWYGEHVFLRGAEAINVA